MNCQEISQLLDDRDLRALSSAERLRVEAHLADCSECAAQWRAYERLIRRAVPMMPSDLPLAVWQSVGATVDASRSRRHVVRPALIAGVLVLGAAAAAIVAIQTANRAPAVAGQTDPVPLSTPAESAAADETAVATTGGNLDELGSAPVAGRDGAAEAPESSGPTIALDAGSIAVLPVELLETNNPALLAAANDIRTDIIREIEASSQLNLVDPELVRSYFDAGMPDIDIGRTLGVGNVIFIRGEQSDGRESISFGTLDPATDRELYYGTIGFADGPQSAGVIRVNDLNVNNLVERLTLAANPGLAPSREETIASNQAIALNERLEDVERVAALAELRSLGPEARTDAMVVVAIELASNADDPMVRNRAWFTLSDADDPSIVQPLLNALRFDPSETVRGVAVRLLGEYIDEFGVREALELAATEDTDAGIRTQAARALLSEQELYRQVRQTFFDSSLPAEQRVNALQFHFGTIGPGLSIDADIADELFTIAFDQEMTSTWAATLLYYADALDPKFIDPLLELVAGEPEHRATAAGLLGHFNDRPVVVAALEQALGDPDRNVRNNAQRALERTPWPAR